MTEIIVVVVILGVLMAIVVPALMTMRDRGNDASALSSVNVARRTVSAFGANGIYAAHADAVAARLG